MTPSVDHVIGYPDSNRVGCFHLPDSIQQDRDLCRALLSVGKVLKHGRHPDGNAETFYVASDMFDPLSEGEEIPVYRIDFVANCPFDDPDKEARRVNVGPFGFVAIRQYILRVPPATFALRAH